MSKKDVIEVEATVIDAMPNTIFKVKLENGHEITAHIRKIKNELYKNSSWR